jgi:hypothetical protein
VAGSPSERKALFVELVTHLIALIKDQEHGDALTSEQRVQKRTRAYALAEEIGAWFDEA